MKLTVLMVGLSLIFLASCDNKSTYSMRPTKTESPKKTTKKTSSKKSTTDTSTKKTSDVGVSNVIDYGTGMTPLKIKNRKKNQLKDIEKSYQKKYDDDLK